MLPVFYLILPPINLPMKKTLVIAVLLTLILGSCAKGLTTFEAANGKQKCRGTYIK